jgi:hypothetical protein
MAYQSDSAGLSWLSGAPFLALDELCCYRSENDSKEDGGDFSSQSLKWLKEWKY